VQTKEWWNVELKGIFPYSLGEGVWPISKRTKLVVGSNEAFLLQMQPHFVAHLEFVWHPILIMSLLVLSIGSVQDVMNLLVDVLNVLNEVIFLIYL
jgi:hypothetical protein